MDESSMRSFLDRNRRLLAQLTQEGRLDERRRSVFQMYAETGAILHALGEPAAAREAFGHASEWALRTLEARDPTQTTDARTPRELIDMTAIVIAFGRREDRARIAALPRSAWYLPEKPYWEASAAAASYLLRHLASGGDEAELQRAMDLCADSEGSDDMEAFWADDLLLGLMGILRGSIEDVFDAFGGLIRLHLARARGEWEGTTDALVAHWASALAVLAAEAGLDVYATAPQFPEAALDLRVDAVWHGPWSDRESAEAAADLVLGELGYARGEDEPIRRQLDVLRIGDEWWLESDRVVGQRLAGVRPADLLEASLTNFADRDEHAGFVRRLERVGEAFVPRDERVVSAPGIRRGDLRQAAREQWITSRGPAARVDELHTIEYAARPVLGRPTLDVVYHALREAETWRMYVDVEPIQLAAERSGRGRIYAIVEDRDDWQEIEAKLRD